MKSSKKWRTKIWETRGISYYMNSSALTSSQTGTSPAVGLEGKNALTYFPKLFTYTNVEKQEQ